MLDYREGAKSATLCENCGTKVPSTLTNETISLCEGLEEIANVLVDICDNCGGICSIPYESIEPVQYAIERLRKSKTVASYGEITIELKSQVDARKSTDKSTKRDYPQEYPLVAATG